MTKKKTPKEIKKATQDLLKEAKINRIEFDSIYKLEQDDKIILISPPNRAKSTHDIQVRDKENYELKDIINLPQKFWTKNLIYRRFLRFLEDNDIEIENEKALKVSLEKAYEKYIEKEEMQQKEKIELSLEETKEALKLAKDPEILLKILSFKEKELLHAGENKNFLHLYLTATSRKHQRPLADTVKGISSGGKNFTVKNVLRFIPEEEIVDFTRLTAQALYYPGKLDFKHKVLYIYEKEGSAASDYSIRSLQSEGQLKLGIPIKNPKTGDLEMKYKIVEGPIAFIETTTQAIVNPENESRCFDLFINETEEQTKQIFEVDKDQVLPLDEEKLAEKLKPFQDMQRVLDTFDVIIPYKSLIEFPTKPVRVRRDFQKFLAMIEASAIVHQKQRIQITANNKKYILANLFDYSIATLLCSDILESIVKNINPKTQKIIDVAKKLKDTGKINFGYKELRLKLDCSKSLISEWIQPAVEYGYIDILEGGKGKPYVLTYNDENKHRPTVRLVSKERLSELILVKGQEIKALLNRSQISLESTNPLLLSKKEEQILKSMYMLLGFEIHQLDNTQTDTQNANLKSKKRKQNTKKHPRTVNKDSDDKLNVEVVKIK